jgi:acetyl-CoA carboxylase biotin carboxyl carrier protein
VLTFEQIKELIELVAKHRLSGFEMERSGFRLKVEGECEAHERAMAVALPQAGSYVAPVPPPVSTPLPVPAATTGLGQQASPSIPEGEAAESEIPSDAHVLKSPIVGTFYSAPSPELPAFVQPGDRVKKGQVLCIVEAMKLMNEIESDMDGEIVHVFSDNGQPVEFDEPLYAIRAH